MSVINDKITYDDVQQFRVYTVQACIGLQLMDVYTCTR